MSTTERSLRGQLGELGYRLHKQDDRYMISDTRSNAIVAGSDHGVTFTMTLDDAWTWLRDRAVFGIAAEVAERTLPEALGIAAGVDGAPEADAPT